MARDRFTLCHDEAAHWMTPPENGNQMTGKSWWFFRVMPNPFNPFVHLQMDAIFSAHQMTIQSASGTSKLISKLETHSSTTTKSGPSSCPPMDNTLPVLSLDRMQKSMCGAWRQHSSMLVGLGAMQSPTPSSRNVQLDLDISLLRLNGKAKT